MKKYTKFVVSVLVVVSLMLSMFILNVSAASISILGAGEYEVGKSFSVTINFNADDILYAVEGDINYNSSVLRLNSVSGADHTTSNGKIKIVDDGFSASSPKKASSYTLNFTAIAAGNSNISVSMLGGGDATSTASGAVSVKVITPKPSSNANLSSIKLSNGSLSPAFNPNTTNYSATVKYSVDSITISGAVADGGASYTGGGTFGLEVGENRYTLTVTAADGTKKSYTINIKRMSEQETLEAEQAARDADPLLVIIDGVDYKIVNNLEGVSIPSEFTQATATRKESEITILNDNSGKYQLCWLTDVNGENGAFYSRDEDDNFKKLVYVNANDKMYIVEELGDYGILPATFKLSKCMVDGTDIEAIAYVDEALKDFFVLNCYVGGENAYYRFDVVEGTMQRAVDFDTALFIANTEPEVEEPTGPFAWFKGMNKMGKTVFIVIVAAAVLLIALAVILIVKIVSPRRQDDYENDIEYNSNDFILNDVEDDASNLEESPIPVLEETEVNNQEG